MHEQYPAIFYLKREELLLLPKFEMGSYAGPLGKARKQRGAFAEEDGRQPTAFRRGDAE